MMFCDATLFLLTTLTILVWPSSSVMNLENPRTFKDDLGVTHTFSGLPRIVAWSHIAIALNHFGLTKDQLVGVYGQWGGEASDLDVSNPEAGSSFPSDPTPEELQFLASTTNLSPNCFPGKRCMEIDLDLLRQTKADYVITVGYRHTVRYVNDAVREIEEITGKPVIYIDLSQTGPNCTPGNESRCYGKSMIELIHQLEGLAAVLGIQPPKTVLQDRRDLCEASAEFQEASRRAHLNGVRVMAAYIVPGSNSSTFVANPPDDMVLRMFEELGMPLMHVQCDLKPNEETCPLGFFWETVPNGNLVDYQGTGLPKYQVDFWLYDDRTTLMVLKPSFGTVDFPDKAFQAGQFAYWPIGGGTLSYRHAAEILRIVAPSLGSAQRIYPPTECVRGVDVSGIAHRTVGLEGGQYACYDEQFHREEYLQCPHGDDTTALGIGAIVGIAGGALIGLLLVFMFFHQKDKKPVGEINKDLDSVSVPTDQNEHQS